MEMLAGAAVKIGHTIYIGSTHLAAMSRFGRHVPTDMEDGFVTVEGRFVDRREAFRVARSAGQLTEAADDPKQNLALYGTAEPPLSSAMVAAWGTHTFAGVVQ